ncbi:MAG: formate dehydrogenase subunit gamma [Xanthobacteraceae bacterium]|nr:MAG: formate dehydrogenase subunit gamma [Xanthobacteraceae bacterium]
MVPYSPWDIAAAQAIIAPLAARKGATLPILHALQDEFGYIDAAAIPLIADALNLSRAEVHGTVTFYHDFRSEPPGRKVIKLCRAEACQSVGSERLVAHLKQRHGLALDATTADGELTLETVYCLGNCALGPSALVDGELIGRLDETRLSALCGCRAGAGDRA